MKGKGSTHSVTVDRAEMKRGGGGIPTQTGDVVADREARERERARIAAMDRERETERKRNSDNMRERERERDRGLDIPWNPTIRSGAKSATKVNPTMAHKSPINHSVIV